MNTLPCKFYAHRGAHWKAPENTLKAFHIAYDSGFHGVEFDVQLTKDHVPIVFHDSHWNRLTNHKGFVQNTLYKDLKNIRCQKEKIPTLDEFLHHFASKEFYLELKIPLGVQALYRNTLSQKISELLPVPTPTQYLASFDVEILKKSNNPVFIAENSFHPLFKSQSLSYSFWQRYRPKVDFLWGIPFSQIEYPSDIKALILDTSWQKYLTSKQI